MKKKEQILNEQERQLFRQRLEEVFEADGTQVIILMANNRLTDYYKDICGEHLMECIEGSARSYAELTEGKLIAFKDQSV